MGGDIQALDRRAAKAALQWWLDAGVDVPVGEEPRQWLRTPEPVSAAPTPKVIAEPVAPTAASEMPSEFDAFRAWLGSANDLPLYHPGARRIAPTGEREAEIMILADLPGAEDEGQPIGGEAWALTVRMLAAIGLRPEQAYVASLSCFASPGTRIGDADFGRCAEIARRHVALVQPKRLLLFGDGPSRALVGDPVIKARGRAHKVEGVRTVATIHPRMLMKRPEHKSLAWRDLLLLMEEDR